MLISCSMRNRLSIVVLGLLCCNFVFTAVTVQSIIDKFTSSLPVCEGGELEMKKDKLEWSKWKNCFGALTYVDKDNQDKTPLCIHRAPLGTHERFIGFLIEHFAGNFPLWITPVKVAIIPISDKFNDYAFGVFKKLKKNNLRVNIDTRNEKMGAKIRNAEINRVPIMLIVGEKEMNDNTVSVRRKFTGNQGSLDIDDFILQITKEVHNRSLQSSK